MTALRRTLAPVFAAAMLSLVLGGCGSQKDSGPQLHGAGGNQNGPSPAPMTDTGNHFGVNTPGGIGGTPTPDAASNPDFAGGAGVAGGAGSSVSTRSTPDSGLSLVPGAASDGDGSGGAFPTAPPQ